MSVAKDTRFAWLALLAFKLPVIRPSARFTLSEVHTMNSFAIVQD